MIGENIHEKQSVDTFEALAFLEDGEGVREIKITVLNESFVTVDTCGRSRKAFQSLRDDVVTKLIEVGYNVSRLNFGDLDSDADVKFNAAISGFASSNELTK